MKKFLLRAMLLLLVLTTVLGSVGCKSRGKTLMTLKHDGIKVTFSVKAVISVRFLSMDAFLSSISVLERESEFSSSFISERKRSIVSSLCLIVAL